ncbi:hypothetical protein KR093_003997 [Drosophila rubida]|uniref:Protein vein n=1 Tax=Drosophila rubida TaxID=30044 RepID=A0AAD4JWQ0_9MUSC|nr:hypothetical protein KR093_003997 [Drosophila rubida]
MYVQHVRKWSLKTQLQQMPLISLAIYVSNMLLLITCAPTITAAATPVNTQQHQQQQHHHQQQQQQQQHALWEAEESSYYIALPQQRQQQQQQLAADNGSGSSESDNNNILSRLLSRPSNSLSSTSTSNIKLRPATVFDAQQPQQLQLPQQHVVAAQQQVPNTLINSQIYKLLFNRASTSKARRHALPQQQQQQHAAGFDNSSKDRAAATQLYLIQSYDVPESQSNDQTARNRRDFGNISNSNSNSNIGSQRQQRAGGNHRQQQQQDKREHRRQRQQQRKQQRQQQAQHQQQHQQHQQQQQQQRQQQRRKHPRKHRNKQRAGRYCSARDPAQLAFAAPTVFKGVFTSMTADRRTNFSATMKVLQVYKQQRDLQLPQLVRLQFALRNNSGECDIYRERLLPRGLVRGNDLEQSSDISYMMFVQQTNPGNFSILGQPIRVTHSVLESVQMAVNETYAQNASITSITSMSRNNTIENGKELRIICKVEGRPPPKVTWFKDDKSINRKRNVYQFKHHKRRAELIVRSFNSSSDVGKYECRAKNKVSKTIDKRRIMITYPVAMRPDQRSSGYPCRENICFHGGTCMLIPDLSQFYCK